MRSGLRVIGSVFGIAVLGVLVTVLVVWVYSTFIAPGKSISAYQSFANEVGPWVSVTVGPPITFLIVRLVTKRLEEAVARREAVWIMGLYLVLDLIVLVGSSPKPQVWGFAAVSALGRCVAAWLAVGHRSVPASTRR